MVCLYRHMSLPVENSLTVVEGSEAIRDHLQALVEDAQRELTLSVPEPVLDQLRPALSDAVDRGVIVLLLVYGGENTPDSLDGIATLVAYDDGLSPLIAMADGDLTAFGWAWATDPSADDQRLSVLNNTHFANAIYGEFVGNQWANAKELYSAPPPSLPLTTTAMRRAVLVATLHLRRQRRIRAVCTASPAGRTPSGLATVDGRVIGVRQAFIYPRTNRFPSESALVLRTDEGRATVGGLGAYEEEYAATEITLETVD